MTQYFADVLQKPNSGLDVPDLQALAKDFNVAAALIMCRLTIAIAVQCEKNKEVIDRIQGLSDGDQHYLMKAIEQVRSQANTRVCQPEFYSRLCPRSRQGHPATEWGKCP